MHDANTPPLPPVASTPGLGRGRSHLSIGEVLALLQQDYPDITISKIRFLESQGLLNPERTPSGYRKFYDPDVEQLRWVLRQQKENFLPLKVIKDRLAAGRLDAPASDSGLLDLNAASQATPGTDAHSTPVTAGAGSSDTGATVARIGPSAGAPPVSQQSPANHIAASAPTSVPTSAPIAEPAALIANSEPHAVDHTAAPVGAADAGIGVEPMDLGVAVSSVSMSGRELCAASGLAPRQLAELERYGLVTARTLGHDAVYDEDALVVANLAAAMGAYGLEPRHLRMFKVGAEREAGMYEQMALPRIRTNRPDSRRQALDDISRVAALAEQLHRALLRDVLQNVLGPR